MEVPVNEMLRDEISRIDHTLIPPGFRGDQRAVRAMQASLTRVIDELGGLSAHAQGLNKVITTAEKLRNQPTHILYLMKDSRVNEGRGEVIGFLRVGHKRLYLFDASEQAHELEPLCVLDLYVRDDRQRRGHGKKLFEHMLTDQCAQVAQLAIDGPSEKMVSFLGRNYGVSELRRQPNNFAVAPEFFGLHRPLRVGSGRSTPSSASSSFGRFAARKPHSDIASESGASFGRGRFAAPQPHSTMAAVIHGCDGGARHGRSPSAGRANGTTEVTPPDVSERELVAVKAVAETAPDAGDGGPAPLERPNTLHIETGDGPGDAPGDGSADPRATPRGSPAAGAPTPRRDSQVTEQGFFDIKFYHNKLW